MEKKDCLSSEKLILYSDGSLSKEELKEVEEHIKNCSSCKEEVEYLQGVFTKIEVASVCPSVDELIEYNPEGDGSRDIFIKSHIKFCSKCRDILNRLSVAVEQFDEPAKDIKTTKLPEKVSKEIERYYPEQKKMSFWQFLSSFFFSKKSIAVFSSIFVIVCCLLIFKLTFVPQMISETKMNSMNKKISTESKINNKEVDSAKVDSEDSNQNDLLDKIVSDLESDDNENVDEKSKNVENIKTEDNSEESINIEAKTDVNENIVNDNKSNKNSNKINGEYSNKNSENVIDNKILANQNINTNQKINLNFDSNNEGNLEDTPTEFVSQESEEMGQLRREYMQGAEVEIHELGDNTKNVSTQKSEPSKPVEKPVKRYVVPIKPVDSVERETTIQLESQSDSLRKNSNSDRVSQKVTEYQKDTSSNNEIYNQLRKKLITDREEQKEPVEKVPEQKVTERKTSVNVQPVLPENKVSSTPKEEISQKQTKEKKHKVTKEQILEELHKQQESNNSQAPTHKKRFVRQNQTAKSSTTASRTSVPKSSVQVGNRPTQTSSIQVGNHSVQKSSIQVGNAPTQSSSIQVGNTPVQKSSIQVGNAPTQSSSVQVGNDPTQMAQSVVKRAVDMKSNSSSGIVVPSNGVALSKSASSSSPQLSISPLALEYRINTEIGYGSITITSVNEGGSVYYEIKQNRTLTDDDLAVINRICSEYRDIKIRFK